MTDDREQFEMVLQATAAMTLQESEEWSSHYIKRSLEERPDRRRRQERRGLFTYKQLRQFGSNTREFEGKLH